MSSPRLPAAAAVPANEAMVAVSAPTSSRRTRSEVGGELNTTWPNHRSAALKPSETTRRRALGVSLGRTTADRKIEHRAEHQTRTADRERDRRNIAVALGRIDRVLTASRAIVVLALPVEGFLVLHCHHSEGSADTDTRQTDGPGSVGGGAARLFGGCLLLRRRGRGRLAGSDVRSRH